MNEIDELLLPKGSKISFMNKEFVTTQEMIVQGSIKGLNVKKEFYYYKLNKNGIKND